MRLTSDAPCRIHRDHSPNPQLTHIHHVVPKSWGGPDTDKNKIPLCPTSHENIHVLLRLYAKTEGKPYEHIDLRTFGYQERLLAKQGWEHRALTLRQHGRMHVPLPGSEDD